MPKLIQLDEALEGILDSVNATLEAAAGETKPLGKVTAIIRGDRKRTQPKTPAIWTRILNAEPDYTRRSMAEVWRADVILLGIVKNQNPDQGSREATRLAARARSEVLKDRSLGLREYVQDVRSGMFEPSGPELQSNENLFTATALLQVHFTILETNP